MIKRIWRRSICLILSLSIALILIACSNSTVNNASNATNNMANQPVTHADVLVNTIKNSNLNERFD